MLENNTKKTDGKPAYVIDDTCVGCTLCHNECPADAIRFNGDHYYIDQDICVRCGHCADVCNIGAIAAEGLQAPVIPHEDRELDCDILIIGGGASGMTAAVRAAENGVAADRIVVLEAGKRTGGCGYYAVIVRTFASRWDREAGRTDTVEDAVLDTMVATRNLLDPQLVAATYHAADDFFDWICDWTDAETCFTNDTEYGRGVGVIDESYGGGRFIMRNLEKRAQELGIRILTQHRARKLLTDESGRVTGAVASDPGGKTMVSCKVCLIATGGAVKGRLTDEMLPRFAQALPRRYAHLLPTLHGDGQLMGLEAGLPVDKTLTPCYVGPMQVAFDEQVFCQGERCDAMRVNLKGERWINEAQFSTAMAAALERQPRCTSFTVMDSAILRSDIMDPYRYDIARGRIKYEDIRFDHKHYPGGVSNFIKTIGEKTPAEPEPFLEFAKLPGGNVCAGETIEELAKNMGVDPAALRKTVDRYNELCREGKDTDFYKPSIYLKPIEQGPFFAISSYLYADGVYGGYHITTAMEVRDGDRVVPGLYATGDITNDRYLPNGAQKTEILNDFSWACAGGFIAGACMAEYLKTLK